MSVFEFWPDETLHEAIVRQLDAPPPVGEYARELQRALDTLVILPAQPYRASAEGQHWLLSHLEDDHCIDLDEWHGASYEDLKDYHADLHDADW